MPKLLVVDDDEALRRLMRLELSGNYEIIDSGEPDQGLALALESKPDAILLDLRMPKYSGYDLLQTFTSFSRTQAVPVIIVSGEGDGQSKEFCKRLGAVEYFEKPIDFEALRSCLHRVVTARPHIARSEVRVRLRVPLRLRGTDVHGQAFDEPATTEDVSLNGFLCTCAAELATDAVVEVYLATGGAAQVGKARIVRASSSNTSPRQYGCRFVEKTGTWVLQ
jgi:CheY-like chemotaxis protein